MESGPVARDRSIDREPVKSAASTLGHGWLLVLSILFLLVNLTTASRSPTVAMDEAIFTEPAVNLMKGKGFTVPGWNRFPDHFWTGNAPLYSLGLSAWLRVASFTPTGVRSLNYVLALGAALLVCSGSRRAGVVATVNGQAFLFASVLLSYSVSFSYRGGRYDCMPLLICALSFFAATIQSTCRRRLALTSAGLLLPWAGFQMPLYAGLVFVIAVCGSIIGREQKSNANRNVRLRDWTCLALGICAGVLSLLATYHHYGVLEEFIMTIGRHTPVHLQQVEANAFNRITGKWSKIPNAFMTDPFNIFLIVALIVLVTCGKRFVRPLTRRTAWGAVTLAILLPIVFELLYMYRIYYGWMIIVPCLLALSSVREDLAPSKWLRRASTGAMLIIMLGGLPLRLLVTGFEWKQRDYAPVEQLIEKNVSGSDRVYADFSAYYPVKRRAAEVSLPLYVYPPYQSMLLPAEASRISLLVLGNDSLSDLALFPGVWNEIDRYTAPTPTWQWREKVGARPYELRLYRRTGSTRVYAP